MALSVMDLAGCGHTGRRAAVWLVAGLEKKKGEEGRSSGDNQAGGPRRRGD